MLYYKCHKIHFKHEGSYIDFSDWIKKKQATINQNQYMAMVAVNHREIKRYPKNYQKLNLL